MGPVPTAPSPPSSRRAGSLSLGLHQFRSGVHLLEARSIPFAQRERSEGGEPDGKQEGTDTPPRPANAKGKSRAPEVIGKQPLCGGWSAHHAGGKVRRETCPHRTLPWPLPGLTVSPACHPEGNAPGQACA